MAGSTSARCARLVEPAILRCNGYHYSNGTFLLAQNRGHFYWLTTRICIPLLFIGGHFP